MKKLLLLAFTALMVVGCVEHYEETRINSDYSVRVIDSCEYIVLTGVGIKAHKGNCRFCKEQRQNEQAELEQGFIDQHIDKYNRMPTFLDAIEYGMTLQKEQMKEALRTEYEKGRHDALEEMKKSKQC